MEKNAHSPHKDRRRNERRKSTRISQTFIVRFRCTEPYATHNTPITWNLVTAENLSADGMLFKFNKPIELNSLIDIKINFLSSEHPIQCVGRIHRIEKIENSPLMRVSVLFTSISQYDKELIQKSAESVP